MKQLNTEIKRNYSAQEYQTFTSLIENIKIIKELTPVKMPFNNAYKNGIENAKILVKVNLDIDTILASLVLDLVRGKFVKEEDIELSKNVLKLVHSVIEIENIIYSNNKTDIDNLRSMFVAIAKDVRVLIVKLADVLNMARNTNKLNDDEAMHLHNEIKEIYAPLAARLGLSFIKSALQDENFKYLKPNDYKALAKELLIHEQLRKIQIARNIKKIKYLLKTMSLNGEVKGRVKHISSVYKKLQEKESLNDIYDLSAVRIIVDSVNDCYAVLGAIHTHYRPMENRFKDYIAKPKSNGYKSLHTTVYLENNEPLEVQIRTQEMHDHAEYGIAAHWMYKENRKKKGSLDKKLNWVRQIIENQEKLSALEILEELKSDVYAGEIFVKTPKGNILELPVGSTPIDFAYAIHSAVGNKCMGAKVNGKIVPLTYKLQSGDLVEVITSASSKGPSRDWLKLVKSSSARNKINAFFKKEMKEENIKKGKTMLEQAAKQKNVQLHKLIDNKWMQDLYERYSLKGMDDMYSSVGFGALTGNQIITRLQRLYDEHNKVDKKTVEIKQIAKVSSPKKIKGDPVIVKGLNNILTNFAKCCTPVPGDEIIAFISRGRGAIIHRHSCHTLDYVEEERLLPAEWNNTGTTTYQAEVNIIAKNSAGVLASISSKIADLKLNISAITANAIAGEKTLINVIVGISKQEQLAELLKKLNNIKHVYEVYRGTGHQ